MAENPINHLIKTPVCYVKFWPYQGWPHCPVAYLSRSVADENCPKTLSFETVLVISLSLVSSQIKSVLTTTIPGLFTATGPFFFWFQRRLRLAR